MKNSSLLVVAVLAVVTVFASSCSGVRGCKGGGWYGDRNLTLETPLEYSTPAQQTKAYSSACTD